MKYWSFFIIIFLWANFLSAQPKPVKPSSSNDALAEKYLKALKTKLEKSKGYKYQFTITSTDADNNTSKQKGLYWGSGIRYKIELPESITAYDGKTQWVAAREEKEIRISTINSNKNRKAETPVDIIKQYDKLFKYRVKEAEKANIIVLELVPINKNAPYFKVDLSLNTKTIQVLSSKLYDKGGHRISFQFTASEELKAVNTSLFQISTAQYPNYEVLDMR